MKNNEEILNFLTSIKGAQNKAIDEKWISYDEEILADLFIPYHVNSNGTIDVLTSDKEFKIPYTGEKTRGIKIFSYDLDFASVYVCVDELKYLQELTIDLEVGGSTIIRYQNIAGLNVMFKDYIEYVNGQYKVWLPCIGPLFLRDIFYHEAYLVIKNNNPIDVSVGYFKDKGLKKSAGGGNDVSALVYRTLGADREHHIYQFRNVSGVGDKHPLPFDHPSFVFSCNLDDWSDNVLSIDLNFGFCALHFSGEEIKRKFQLKSDDLSYKNTSKAIRAKKNHHLISGYKKIIDQRVCGDIQNEILEYLCDYPDNKFIYVIDLHKNLQMNAVRKPNQSINLSRIDRVEMIITRKNNGNKSSVNISCGNVNEVRTYAQMMGLRYSN